MVQEAAATLWKLSLKDQTTFFLTDSQNHLSLSCWLMAFFRSSVVLGLGLRKAWALWKGADKGPGNVAGASLPGSSPAAPKQGSTRSQDHKAKSWQEERCEVKPESQSIGQDHIQQLLGTSTVTRQGWGQVSPQVEVHIKRVCGQARLNWRPAFLWQLRQELTALGYA